MTNKQTVWGRKLLLALCVFFAATIVQARGVYQTTDEFLNEAFNQEIPQSRVVWLKGEVRDRVAEILGHDYAGLRIRYWQKNGRSAWVLEEIGKEEPITFGIVIKHARVEQVKVLAYRESRGWEVRNPAFTRQYFDAELENNGLNRQIDGISGATLSVRAMTAVVTLALYLNGFISNQS